MYFILYCIYVCFLDIYVSFRHIFKMTSYGLEGPGDRIPVGRDFPHLSRQAPEPTQPPVQWVRVLPGGKGGRGVMLTTHPLLVPRLRKSRAIPPLTLWVLLGLLRGSLYPLHIQNTESHSLSAGIA
jgi:hypothetical protein